MWKWFSVIGAAAALVSAGLLQAGETDQVIPIPAGGQMRIHATTEGNNAQATVTIEKRAVRGQPATSAPVMRAIQMQIPGGGGLRIVATVPGNATPPPPDPSPANNARQPSMPGPQPGEAAIVPNPARPGRARPFQYYLGLHVNKAGPALRAQLALPAGQGLIVERLIPNAPAVKAGLQQYDVLLGANGKPLGERADLVEALQQAKDTPLALDLVRGGKRQTISVTPIKSLVKDDLTEELLMTEDEIAGADVQTLEKLLEKARAGNGPGPMQFRVFHPGVILPANALLLAPLPPNTTVTITKEGSKPAKIVVRQNDKEWELAEGQWDKLPANLRSIVARMLNRGQGIVPQPPPTVTAQPAPPNSFLEQRLEQMSRQLDRLRASLDDLRRQAHPPATP